jgi:hypothetical protein
MTAPWNFRVLYAPLDFSNIPGYPNQSIREWTSQIPCFYGDPLLANQHISCFFDYISDLNIVHEDIWMRIFAMSQMEEAKDWFRSLGKGEISSFTEFTQTFINHWVPIHDQDQNQKIVEGMENEERIDEEGTQATMPLSHEDKDMDLHENSMAISSPTVDQGEEKFQVSNTPFIPKIVVEEKPLPIIGQKNLSLMGDCKDFHLYEQGQQEIDYEDNFRFDIFHFSALYFDEESSKHRWDRFGELHSCLLFGGTMDTTWFQMPIPALSNGG